MLRHIKSFLRLILPAAVVSALRDHLENLRDLVDTLLFGLQFSAGRRPRPTTLLFFGFAPGDDLLCTAILRELRHRGRDRTMILSDHPELFIGNDDAAYVRPLWRRYSRDESTINISRRFVRLWGGEFFRLEYAPLASYDRSAPPRQHIIAEMCARARITGQVSLRPYVHLSEAEKHAAAWARDQIIIQSSGLDALHPIRNKQWSPEGFQRVVDALEAEVDFVQLGGRTDPPLRHARDLRGQTGIREAAAILHHARLYVGTVGFLMHLARAVECPSVIVFGGREAPWQSGYSCNSNIYSATPCAPCWRWNTCDFDHMCMTQIAPDAVVEAIRAMLGRPRNPLAVDVAEVQPVTASPGQRTTPAVRNEVMSPGE